MGRTGPTKSLKVEAEMDFGTTTKTGQLPDVKNQPSAHSISSLQPHPLEPRPALDGGSLFDSKTFPFISQLLVS